MGELLTSAASFDSLSPGENSLGWTPEDKDLPGELSLLSSSLPTPRHFLWDLPSKQFAYVPAPAAEIQKETPRYPTNQQMSLQCTIGSTLCRTSVKPFPLTAITESQNQEVSKSSPVSSEVQSGTEICSHGFLVLSLRIPLLPKPGTA